MSQGNHFSNITIVKRKLTCFLYALAVSMSLTKSFLIALRCVSLQNTSIAVIARDLAWLMVYGWATGEPEIVLY